MTLRSVAAVSLGGAVGAVLRWGVGTATGPAAAFPWATFAINLTGCLALALLPALPVVRRRPLLPPLLGTGLCGGFTTMSAYAEETRALVAAGRPGLAATYAVATLAGCLVAVQAASVLTGRAQRRRFDEKEGDR